MKNLADSNTFNVIVEEQRTIMSDDADIKPPYKHCVQIGNLHKNDTIIKTFINLYEDGFKEMNSLTRFYFR